MLDEAVIETIAGSGALSIGIGSSTGVAVSVGFSLARNDIDNATTAEVDSSTINDAANVVIDADSTSNIDAITVAGAASVGGGADVGVALAGVGAVSLNQINNILEAKAKSSTFNVRDDADFKITADDTAVLTADAGALALSVAGGQYAAVGGAVGASVGINEIGNITRAKVDAVQVNLPETGPTRMDEVLVHANSGATIDTLVVTVTGSVSVSLYAGVSIAAAGAVAINTITNTTEALVQGNSSIAKANTVVVEAASDGDIRADAAAASMAGAAGIGSLTLNFGASVADNDIGNVTRAKIDDSKLESVTTAKVDASSTGRIDALAVGVLLTGSLGAASVNIAALASITNNDVHSTTEAVIAGSAGPAQGLVAGGDILVNAADHTTINAKSFAGGITGSFSAVGGSITVVASPSTNHIDNTVRANIDASKVESAGGTVDVIATSDNDIDAWAGAVAVSIDISPFGLSFSATGAGSSAKNYLGKDSNTATEQKTEASITGGSDVDAARQLNVKAVDASTIDSNVLAVAVGVASFNVAIGVSITDNQIGGTVAAFVTGSSASAGEGNLEISAVATQTIIANGVSVAGSISIGGAGAGSQSSASIDNTVRAYASAATLSAPGRVSIEATSTLTADVDANGGAAGVVGISVMLPSADIGGSTTASSVAPAW